MPRKSPLLPPAEPTSLVPPRLWGLLAFVPLVLWYFAPGLRPALQDSPYPDYTANFLADDLLDAPTTDTVRMTGVWVRDGEGLSPEGDLKNHATSITVPGGLWDRAVVQVYGAPDSTWAVRLVRRGLTDSDGQTYIMRALVTQKLKSETPLEIAATQIPGGGISEAPLLVEIEPREPGRAAPGKFPLLRRVELRFTCDMFNRLPMALPDAVGLGLLPLLVALMFRTVFGMEMKRCVTGGFAFGMVFCYLLKEHPEQRGVAWSIATGIAGVIAAHGIPASRGLTRKRVLDLNAPAAEWHALMGTLLLAFVSLLALWTRWSAFEVARRETLGWDATGYVEIALSAKSLYATEQSFAPWVREPLWPWVLRAWLAMAPITTAAARMLSIALGVGAVAAVFAVGRRLFGVWPALVAAFAIAASPDWARESARVLRIDLIVLVVMGLFAARVFLEDRRWGRAAAMGVMAALAMLTQLSLASLALPVLAWEAWRKKWNIGEILLGVALTIVPVLPHLAYSHRSHGDAFFASTEHVRYYANREFAGEPGFPTKEEVKKNPYAGEPMGGFAYFFQHHGFGTVIWGHIKGMWDRFVWGSPRVVLFRGHEWLMLPGLIGAWVLWRDKKAWVLGWFVLAALPCAFIASRGAVWRIGAEAHVVVLWIWALGVEWMVRELYGRIRARNGRLKTEG